MSNSNVQIQHPASVHLLAATERKWPWRWPELAGAVLLAVVAFLIYIPSLSGGYILDDDLLLTDNALIKAPDGLFRVWYSTQQPDYVPLTCSSLWLEWRLWGINPTGYHVTNLLLHIAACLLLWRLLQKLSIPGAYLAALLYAVHPVNVESVAWIEQRKDTLSMLLFLLSILWWLRAEEGRVPAHQEGDERRGLRDERRGTRGERRTGSSSLAPRPSTLSRWYWLSLLAFALAMFSKGSVAVLPLLLLLIVWWQGGKITKWDLLRSVPFFLVAAVLTPVIIWFVIRNAEAVRNITFVERLLGAGSVIWFYLSKALAPIRLIFVYPQWNIQMANWRWWLPLTAAVIVTALLFRRRHREWNRALLFAWLFFCVALLPVLGFTDPGYMKYSPVADHYQHIPLIAVVALAAAGWSVWRERSPTWLRWSATTFAFVVVSTLMLLTWHQNRLYAGPITLYRATVHDNPNSCMAHSNLAAALLSAGQTQEAIDQLHEALRLKPDDAESHCDLGIAMAKIGRPQEALEQYQQAVQSKPNFPQALYNLGNALNEAGRPQEAIDHLREALEFDPDYVDAYVNLGNILSTHGRLPQAILCYKQAIELDPNIPKAHYNLALALVHSQQLPEAIAHYQQAVRLEPDYVEARVNLGNALLKSNRPQEAIQQYDAALRLKPDNFEAHVNLGAALAVVGRFNEAIEHDRRAFQLKPESSDALANMALAYAAMKRSAEAIATAQKALDLARSQGNAALAGQVEDWLKKYQAERGNSQNASPQSAPARPAP